MENENVRSIIAELLEKIIDEGGYCNIILNQYFTKNNLSRINRALITQVVNGTVSQCIRIDYIINRFSKVKVKKMKKKVANVLRMSVYQALYLNKIPDSAICNEAVKIIKNSPYKQLSGFVNGVLRNIIRNQEKIQYPKPDHKEEYLSIAYSFPKPIINHWLSYYPFSFVENLLKVSNEPSSICLRCNISKIQPKELLQLLHKNDIEAYPGEYVEESIYVDKTSDIRQIPGYKEGFFQVQDESSMLVAHAANPTIEDTIIDVCAAPGGKITHFAEILQNQGNFIARDIHPHKLDLIHENVKRLHLKNIAIQEYDALQLDEDLIEQGDKVIVDAPCSGLGIIRKKPDIKLKNPFAHMDDLLEIQRQILGTVYQYVKPGGILLYSTCTINPKENQKMVEWFIKHYPFDLIHFEDCISERLHPYFENRMLQLFPHIHGVDGFFIAKLRKKE